MTAQTDLFDDDPRHAPFVKRRSWTLAHRAVTCATNRRTAIWAILPPDAAVGHAPILDIDRRAVMDFADAMAAKGITPERLLRGLRR